LVGTDEHQRETRRQWAVGSGQWVRSVTAHCLLPSGIQQAGPSEQLHGRPAEGRPFGLGARGPSGEDEVVAGSEARLQPNGLANAPTDSVADHRASYSLADGDADTRLHAVIGRRVEDQQRGRPGALRRPHTLEIGMTSETLSTRGPCVEPAA